MRRDHRPYLLKKLDLKFQNFFAGHFLRPQFEALGDGFTIIKPWHVIVFGNAVRVGNYVNIIASNEKKVRLSVWPKKVGEGRLVIGDYCLVCPGARISAALEIVIEDNCMIASDAYITDSDWHDIYNRITSGKTSPVLIKENAWIGDSAIVCKGVTIGENSIVGAGSVVTDDVPPNTIVAGNPAKVVKILNENEKITKRSHWYSDPANLSEEIDRLDRSNLSGNTILHWLRAVTFPKQGD